MITPYYEEEGMKIYLGDCLEIMREIPDESIDLVLTDPPYFLPAKHYETRRLFKRNFGDLAILENFFRVVWEQFDRVLKEDGLLYIFCDGQSYPLFYYYSYFITRTVRPLIWDKKVSFNGYYWRHQHEIILFGVRAEKKKIPTGKGDILRFDAVKVDKRQHPAEKPLDLIKELLSLTTKNDLVLDPFMGSGTTLVACKELGRQGIGIEINKEYCDIAVRRIKSTIRPLF
jgi:site-specific DNA-methyltransferase (adenine-specific)